MKTFTLFAAFVFSALLCSAQVVSLHSVDGVTLFNGTGGFVAAYDASADGDTIYIPGGGFTVPSSINKKLLIIGAGHYPDSTQATSKTFLNGSLNLQNGADGLRIEGVHLTGTLTLTNNHSVNNVIVKYSSIDNLAVLGNMENPSMNLTLINTVILGTVSLANAQNAAILNCFIGNRVTSTVGNLFENNIFFYSYTGHLSYYTFSGSNNNLNNNIFLNASTYYFTGTSNRIYNNLFRRENPIYGTTPIQSGNYIDIAIGDIFVEHTGSNFSYESNYHLQNPELYLGTDNRQVGLYGGEHDYKEGALPSNPHIQFQKISPITTSEGILEIEIRVGAQDR